MANRRSRSYHHDSRGLDVNAIRRRNRFLILIVLLLLAFLLVYNRRHERQLDLVTRRRAVQEAFLEIGGALDRYRADNGTYPVETPGIYTMSQLVQLTTPHTYLWDPDVIQDPFAEDEYRISMLNTIPTRWLLISAGPNEQREMLELPPGGPLGKDDVRDLVARFRYDPTNGNVSRGDILLLGK